MTLDPQLGIPQGGLPAPRDGQSLDSLAVCTDATHNLWIPNSMRPVRVSLGGRCRMISLPKRNRAGWKVSAGGIKNLTVATRRDRRDWIDLEFDAVASGPATITALSSTGRPVGVIHLLVE